MLTRLRTIHRLSLALAFLLPCLTGFQALANSASVDSGLDWIQISDEDHATLHPGSVIALPDAELGNRGAPRFFAIHNEGTVDVTGLTLSFASGDTDDFQSTVAPPPTIPVGGKALFALAFIPTVEGARTMSVEISSDDSTQTPFALSFSSDGRASAPSAVRGIRVSPLAHTAMAAPDYVAGAEFINFRDAPVLGDNSGDRVLFRGNVSTPSGNRDSFWQFQHGDSVITRGVAAGDSVQGAPAGALLTTGGFSTLAYGPNASVAVSSLLQGGGVT